MWAVTRNVLVPNAKDFFKKRGIVGIAGGIWAMIPDLDYFLEEDIFKNAAWNDIFFFHSSFDKVLTETDLFFAVEMLLLFVVVNLFMMIATVGSFVRLKEAIFGREEEEDEEGEEEHEDAEGNEVEEVETEEGTKEEKVEKE